jgi:hypothetical protein
MRPGMHGVKHTVMRAAILAVARAVKRAGMRGVMCA